MAKVNPDRCAHPGCGHMRESHGAPGDKGTITACYNCHGGKMLHAFLDPRQAVLIP